MSTSKAASAKSTSESSHAVSSDPAPALPMGLAQRLGNENLQALLRARVIQAKLSVSDPGDSYEQEADRVADQVMRMPESTPEVGEHSGPAIQRMCSQCEDELQRSEEPASSVPEVSASVEHSIGSLAGRGRPLPDAVRAFMEPRFNADFGSVRLHTDSHAHDLARSVKAQAFTIGHNVVFGAGYYSPDTDGGRRLLAHELTHTIQQRGATNRISRAPLSDFDCGTTFFRNPEPLAPRTWRRCVTAGKVGLDSEDTFRWTETGEIFGEDGLIAWAMNEAISPRDMIARILHSHAFSGSQKIRELAANKLEAAIEQKSLDERRKERDEQIRQAKEEDKKRQDEWIKKRKQEQAQDRRRRWIKGEGVINRPTLEDVSSRVVRNKQGAVAFDSYDDKGERAREWFPSQEAFRVGVRKELDKLKFRGGLLPDEVFLRYRLDRRDVAETLDNAAWYQRPGLWLPGVRMGFSKLAIMHGVIAAKYAQYSAEQIEAAKKALDEGDDHAVVEALNEARLRFFQAKHSLNKMVLTRDQQDQDSLAALNFYKTTGEYAEMFLPPVWQIGLGTLKRAGTRLSAMHSDDTKEFGWGGFLWETTVSIASLKAQGLLAGKTPGFARSFGANVATGQLSKFALTGDASQLLDFNAQELLLAAGGAAHSSWSQYQKAKAAGASLTPSAEALPTTPFGGAPPTAALAEPPAAANASEPAASVLPSEPATSSPKSLAEPLPSEPATSSPKSLAEPLPSTPHTPLSAEPAPSHTRITSESHDPGDGVPRAGPDETTKPIRRPRPTPQRAEPRTAEGEIHSKDPNPPTHVADDSAKIKAIHTPGNDPTRLSESTIIARLRALKNPRIDALLDAMKKAGARIRFNFTDPAGKKGVDGYVVLDNTTGTLVNKDVYINLDRALGYDKYSNTVDLTRDPLKAGATTGAHEVTHTDQDFTKGYDRGHELEARKAQRLVDPESVPKSDADLKAEIDRDYAHLPAPEGWFDDGHQPASPSSKGAAQPGAPEPGPPRVTSEASKGPYGVKIATGPEPVPNEIAAVYYHLSDGTRLVTVHNGKPYYQSLGKTVSDVGEGPKTREPGEFYHFLGALEAQPPKIPDHIQASERVREAYRKFHAGWLQKGPGVADDAPVRELRSDGVFRIENEGRPITDAKQLNDWLRSKGAQPVGDYFRDVLGWKGPPHRIPERAAAPATPPPTPPPRSSGGGREGGGGSSGGSGAGGAGGPRSSRILSQSHPNDFEDAPDTIVDAPPLKAVVLEGEGVLPNGEPDPDRIVIAIPSEGPVYLSSSTSPTHGLGENVPVLREKGQAYKCFGFQEGTSMWGADGWVIKFEHLGSQYKIPGFLENNRYEIVGRVRGPKAVNDWLESQGVKVYRHPFKIPSDVMFPDGPPKKKK